jgi:hypothetical protein
MSKIFKEVEHVSRLFCRTKWGVISIKTPIKALLFSKAKVWTKVDMHSTNSAAMIRLCF